MSDRGKYMTGSMRSLMAKLQKPDAEEKVIISQIYLKLIIIGKECYSLLIKSHWSLILQKSIFLKK